MKTYFLDTRTVQSPFPLVLPVGKAITAVPRKDHCFLKEIGSFRTRREMRKAVKRLQATA